MLSVHVMRQHGHTAYQIRLDTREHSVWIALEALYLKLMGHVLGFEGIAAICTSIWPVTACFTIEPRVTPSRTLRSMDGRGTVCSIL
jgi:hypothetical protein